MDSNLYNQIIKEYNLLRSTNLITDMRIILKTLVEKFSSNQVNEEVIRSIVSYQCQQEQKEKSRLINWNMIFNDYQNGVGLLSIAATAGVSPALVSQRIINNQYSSVTTQNQLKEYQFNSNAIDNCYLAFESMLAHYSDPFYGIHYTQISNNSGQVFEQKVENYLRKANVDFMSEDELRKKNYDVTPDFKLNLPIILERHWTHDFIDNSDKMITNNDSNNSLYKKKCIKNYLITKPIQFQPLKLSNLNQDKLLTIEDKNVTRDIINWIECKSLFANEQCHREYTQNQYNSYVNRFGKGVCF